MTTKLTGKKIYMEGQSTLIIGRGRVGKSGFTFDLVEEEERSDLHLVISPRRTIQEKMEDMDFVSWSIMNADDLETAWNDHAKERKGPLLVLLINPAVKGQQSIWEILRDERFRNFTIHAEELAILTASKEDWDQFDVFIRVVGQNNQNFYANTHRIKRDLSPAWIMNFQRIFFVGPLFNGEEAQALYDASTVCTKMDFKAFEEKLKNQPEKYNWWDPYPNKNASFQIYG